MSNLNENILQTIRFFDILNMPLREKDIWQYLWRCKASLKEVRAGLETLVQGNQLEQVDEFYVLPGRGEALVLAYVEAHATQDKLWRVVKRAKRWLQWLPYIRGVFVCNSLAFGNTHTGSDIDLLIVVEPRHIWHARFLATVSMHYKRLRRHGDKVAGRICLSFFVTTDALNFEPMKIAEDDVYLSYWIRTLKPVFGIGTYRHLMQENEWVKQDIPNFTHDRDHALMPRSPLAIWYQRIDEGFMIKTGLAKACEKLLRTWMLPRVERKRVELGLDAGTEDLDRIQKFHDHDRRGEIRDKWLSITD